MSYLDSMSEETLNKATKIVIGLIVIALLVSAGFVVYRQLPKSEIPPLVQEEIDKNTAQIAKNPKDADAHATLGNLYLGQKMYDEAKKELETALALNKDHIAALSLLGQVYEQEGQITKAIDYYKKAIALSEKTEFQSLNPYMYESMYRLGSIYLDRKKYKDAIAVLSKGVALNQIDSDLRYKLGEAYVLDKKPDEAIAQFEVALKYVPDFAEVYFWMGRAYELKGDKGHAKQAYANALKMKKGYKEAEEALKKLK